MIFFMMATSPVPPDGVETAVFNVAEPRIEAAKRFAVEQGLPTQGVKYKILLIGQTNDTTPLILCVQRKPLILDPSQAALLDPHGQRGQNRPAGELDSAGFQALGDEALPTEGDGAMYQEPVDGTFSDIINEGGAPREIPRPQ